MSRTVILRGCLDEIDRLDAEVAILQAELAQAKEHRKAVMETIEQDLGFIDSDFIQEHFVTA